MNMHALAGVGIGLAVAAMASGGVLLPLGDDEAPALKLTIGDKAPPIDVEHWLKGEKVTGWGDDTVHVLEFWATWCGPCRASMPHISELQAKYKDYGVTFLGVSDEKLETVKGFLEKPEWDQKTRYTIATDPDGSTKKAYMEAALQRGIPTAFIIGKDGTVEWIGHPMTIDEPLERIVKGEWDAAAFRKSFEQEIRVEQEMVKRSAAIREAIRNEDWPTVIRYYDELIQIAPDNPQFKIEKFNTLLARMNEPTKAYAFGRELVAEHGQNPMVMNAIAWFVVDDESVETRDLGFALLAAEKANAAAGGKDAAILDTLARVHFEMGDVAKAIEIQRKAAAMAPEGPMGDSIRETLKRYEERAAG